MFDALPQPDGSALASAPVQLATFQIDFEEERPLAPRDGISWKKALEARGFKIPRLSPVHQRTVNITLPTLGGVSEQSVASERSGWQAFLEDGTSNFSLFSTGVNIERVAYPGYAQFRQEMLNAFEIAADLLQPKVQNRIYVSYANALSDRRAENVRFWVGKVRPYFLGAPTDEALSASFIRSLTVASFGEGPYAADLKLALQPDQVHRGRVAFVFQSEIALKGVREIGDDDLGKSLDDLHEIALKMFHAVLEPEYVAELREGVKTHG